MTQPAYIRIDGLSKSFGGVHALEGLDLAIDEHPILTVIGPNGAGKTTLLNVISGYIAPDHGSAAFRGRRLSGLRPDQINALGVVRTFQTARAFASLSVLENLMLFAADQPGERPWHAALRARGSRERERAVMDAAHAIAARLRLTAVLGNPADQLSGGQKKLLDLGRVLMREPTLILLDEPVAGVNPALAEEIGALIRSLAAEGQRFLIVEHNMNFVRAISDFVVVMAAGRHLASGTFAEITENEAVQEAYLGGQHP
jgi:branched-chain amino acid transport system ATP-binding protein/neutral amino acid transport system ATP-binding protein